MQQLFKLLKRGSSSVAKDNMGRDVISELPDALIYLIIKHLTLRDAVKTSVLSRRWKGVCCCLKNLQFDWVNMFQDAGNSEFYETCESPCREYRDKFVGAVDRFLNSYHGDELCRPSGRKYHFSSELFEERETANLELLKLSGCVLGPNFAGHFVCLEKLRLDAISLYFYDMESVFTGLINLRHLGLSRCSLPSKLYFGSLPLLECLQIHACSGIKRIRFSNANLLDFSCFCHGEIVYDLSGAPTLNYFCIDATTTEMQYVLTRLPEHIPKLETLCVRTRSNWAIDIPESITIFREVTSLSLIFNSNGKFDILKMISIVRAFPSLQNLIFMTSCSEDVHREKHADGECAHEHLKEVELSGFYNTPDQIEFAIYLLKHAFSLERLVIRPTGRYVSVPRQSWHEGERECVHEQLHEFSKNSVLTIL